MIAKCPFYYDLKDVFCARSGVCPKVTSKDLYDEDEAGSVGSLAGDYDDRSLSVLVLGVTSSDEDKQPTAASARNYSPALARKLTAQASGKNLPSAKKNSSTKKSLRSRRGHKKHRKRCSSSDDDDGPSALKRVATHWIYTRMKREEKNKSAASYIAELSTMFKTTAENLGSRVKAAFQCPDFERFLELEEFEELKQYCADMEAARRTNS
mmetsp:Transcript_5904/g.12809  ORF Transcript_5904/g.12809 Transcript_5904/m.12809 type:complete len:210 (+) Transcript_5904:2-631(+)